MTEPGLVQLTQFFDQPTKSVWAALTEPALIAKWWAPGDIRPTVGHRFTLDMGNWGVQACEVLAVETERLLSYAFAPGTLDTTITWRLTSEKGGTGLSFEHRGFDLGSPIGRTAFQGMSAGWPSVLARMHQLLSTEG
jgi:uncharacterized protein YndB with AHSA1/START domain